ncbi:hypothetical protein N7478_005966 [Penicillium angulare]|uniref:uncharacterized protein n=1 Tax=Penicillium angulare TaxID=116970 RepID=UPI00253F9D77|nr:uncharacterized protein N7478_005966 [Penicillium angulare]KAJ5280594.1 hypothetical protein N7478_005966 [Penicillium angulare]
MIPTPASYTSAPVFEDTVLQVSNGYRDAHEATGLVWNETLTKYARDWAETCIWKHSDGPYGENIAFGYPNASAAVEAWGNEGELYNFNKPTGFTEATGHFTQLVWKSTLEVGCAAVNCGYTEDFLKAKRDVLGPRTADGSSRAQGWYVVCEYTPVGNVVGDHDEYFKKNVLPSNPSHTSSTETASATTSTTAKTSATSASAATTVTRPSVGVANLQGRVESEIQIMLLALGVVWITMGPYT